ncbi:uncharacterized protein [Henckelia pumila]|uniref:uncharacterized protein n=1 Tax=Henckelia pumila TaxID=405737 RepID=UPI003C6E06EC
MDYEGLLFVPGVNNGGFYGFPERSRRRASWNLLHTLAHRSSLLWKKIGRLRHPTSIINDFRETLNVCGLFDLVMKGHWFTWERSRGTTHFVDERLDRALAISSWLGVFSTSEVINLDVVSSDHNVILLKPSSTVFCRNKRFRFENSWLLESKCKAIVKQGWLNCNDEDIRNRIASCGRVGEIFRFWGIM